MRYINFCPQKKTKDTTISNYQRYLQTYRFYEDTPQRKAYMKQYNKAYREQNADEIECDCGSIVKTTSLYAHNKSQKHLAYLTG